MYQSGQIISGLSGKMKFDKIQLEGAPHQIHNQTDKYWMRGSFVCDKFSDGPSCSGCIDRCGEHPLFVKIYEGSNPMVIRAMENQGSIQIPSAYIAKTYGVIRDEGKICVVTEYIKGESVAEFCKKLRGMEHQDEERPLTAREQLVLKYRLMRQMLYAVRDYQRYRRDEQGIGVYLDLKSEHFLVTRGRRWHDLQIKLIDFEGFTNRNQRPPSFQLTEAYAHPAHRKFFEKEIAPTQIEPAWDYYALGIVFCEMLEGELLFSAEERTAQLQDPEGSLKKITLRSQKEMRDKERKQLAEILQRMVSLTNPWSSIEELILCMNRFLNDWIRKDEGYLLRSAELLMREEHDFLYAPYVKVQFAVEVPQQKRFFQTYELMQGGIIPLAYHANVPIWNEGTKMAAYLFESDGALKCFSLETEQMQKLEVGSVLRFGVCSMTVVSIMQMGYKPRTAESEGTVIDEI